jgi:Methane oxygenase PmoA
VFRLPVLVALAVTSFPCGFDSFASEITVERSEKGAVVKTDGKLFTEYLVRLGTRPILWPIVGPTGKPMTRDFPMRNRAGEKEDHPHQRSLWSSHGGGREILSIFQRTRDRIGKR